MFPRRPPTDEEVAVFDTIVAKQGQTTAPGNAGGTSIIDSGLKGSGANSYVNMGVVLYPGDPQHIDARTAVAFNNITGELTLDAAYKGIVAPIPAGVPYILTPLPSSAVIPSVTNFQKIAPDGVYLDVVAGVAGTVWPTGTPWQPSNNLADTQTMLAARKLEKIYLIGDGPGPYALTLTDGLVADIIGNPLYDITVAPGATVQILGDLVCASYTNTTGTATIKGKLNGINGVINGTGSIAIGDDAHFNGDVANTSGSIYVYGKLKISQAIINQTGVGQIICDDLEAAAVTNSAAGRVQVNGDAAVFGPIVNNDPGGGGIIQVLGKLKCPFDITNTGQLLVGPLECSSISNTGANPVTVGGDCKVSQHIVNSGGGAIAINGKLDINGDPAAGEGYLDNTGGGNITIDGDTFIPGNLTNPAAVITIDGILRCYGTMTNTGTLTYVGVFPEQAVNVSAIVAPVANVINLTATNKRHWTVDSLVIKCANPGVDTVHVYLNQRVNGVLLLISTFNITAANFTNYFSLMDMFGVPHLVGDEIKVTVDATGGAGYAVTGSYSCRSEANGGGATGIPPG